jgi:hypothetical protein
MKRGERRAAEHLKLTKLHLEQEVTRQPAGRECTVGTRSHVADFVPTTPEGGRRLFARPRLAIGSGREEEAGFTKPLQ